MTSEAAPTDAHATDDLDFLRRLLARSERRVDPHAFHFVHWGLIVLVWYPLSNALELADDRSGWPWSAALRSGSESC